MDKDRSKLNSNKRPACTKCTKPDTCIHLRTLRQQQMENNNSTRVLHVVQNFKENRSDEDIFFDCMSFGDNDNGYKSSSCKSSSGKSSNQKGTGQCPTKSEGSKFDDLEAIREVLERVNERLQMSWKKSDCRKSCNATLEITARLITDSESNPNCRFQGRPVTMKMPLEFDPSTGQFGSKSVESSRHMCKKPCSQSSYSQSYSGCPALIYMQDERPSPRQAPDANANAEAENDNDKIPNRSLKMQTDESYLKDKWRPNRTDFEQESNDVSVKSSQTDTQSKNEVPIPSKPSQTDTSFLYDQYVRSRNKNTTQDSPSQTVLKPELNLMGNLRYPTQYVPGMQETKINAPSNTSSRNISRRPSEPSVPRTDAMSQSNGEKCECADPSLNVCPSKSMPIISDPNAVTSNAFQSTCSKQSTQPSQDTSKWYSLESDTSTRMDPAASKPVFCPMKSCKSMPEESMLSRCTCKSDGDLDNFKSIQSSHLGHAPLDLESNMQSTQTKLTKCNIKSTQSTQSLPCGENSKNAPCVTVVYCPLRDYVNGPTSIDIEMGQYPNDPSNDATNWQSARSNISDSCGPNSTCMCSDSTFTKSKDTCFHTVEGNPTEATAWDSARSDNCNACASNDPTTAPAWKSLKSDKSCTCGSNNEDPMETNPTTATAWNSVRSERSCLCGSNKQNADEINPTPATPWHSVKSTKSCACDSRNENLMTKPSNTCFLSMESNKTAVTAWNSLKPDESCACNTSNQIPRTSNPPTIAWMSAKSDKSCGSNNVNLSDTETCSTIRKSVPTAVPTTTSATPWMSIKSDKPCRCGSSNQSPGSKSSNTEQTSSRSRSVMAKVTCLCSSEERAKLGDTGREDYDGPPFARVEESNNDTDVSAVDPCLISAAGTDSEAYVKNVEEEPIYNTCYIPSQGTKVVFMKADGFCDCQSSSNTSLQDNAGKDDNKSVEGSPRDQDEQTMAKKSKSSSCMCSKVLSEDLKSHPRSQNPSMKSAMSCSCAKETGQDYKSERSNQTTCSCIKTSKYDISMNDFSMEPESVGVVMTCDTTVCVDKETFDKLSGAASAQNARDRLFNMVNLVTSNRDPSVNRSEVAQQIIRELTLMLRKEEEESKTPKLSFEDCMEAVQRGERPVKKQYKTQAEINRQQCLDRMEQYLQTCFPQKKKIQEMEIVAFEIDPDFDPYRRSPSPVTEPEIRDEPMFRSCYTDIDARFMTPKGGSTGTPSTVESPGSLKMDSDSKIPSTDASPQLRDAPEALSRVSVEPQASPQLSDGLEVLSSPSSDPNGPPQPSDGAEASSRASADPKASAQPSDGPETTSRVSSEPQGSPQPSDGPETAPRGSADPRASAQLSDRPEASSRASSEPKASPRPSSEPKASSRPSAESKALLESSAEPDVSSRPNEEFLSTQQPNSGLPCGNELCPEATSQGPKSTMDSCQLCELDPNDPLSPLTDRERLLCEYLLRRMCELCDEDQVLDEDYDGDADGDCGGRPPPNQPCLCCHCRALVCDNQCKTVSKTLDSAMYDPVAEMKFFIDSVVFDLQAMDHVMKKNLINPKAPRPSPCMGNAPGESFPVSITDVSSLGCRALYIRWELQDCSGVGGYEIYVDGHLTNRLYSHRHEAVVVSNVDVSKRHQIILRALAIGQEFPGDERSNCAMINAHPEMRVGAQQPWTPSVYFYEP